MVHRAVGYPHKNGDVVSSETVIRTHHIYCEDLWWYKEFHPSIKAKSTFLLFRSNGAILRNVSFKWRAGDSTLLKHKTKHSKRVGKHGRNVMPQGKS